MVQWFNIVHVWDLLDSTAVSDQDPYHAFEKQFYYVNIFLHEFILVCNAPSKRIFSPLFFRTESMMMTFPTGLD